MVKIELLFTIYLTKEQQWSILVWKLPTLIKTDPGYYSEFRQFQIRGASLFSISIRFLIVFHHALDFWGHFLNFYGSAYWCGYRERTCANGLLYAKGSRQLVRLFMKQPRQQQNLNFRLKIQDFNQFGWILKLIKDLIKGFWPCWCRGPRKMVIEWKERDHGEEDE